MHDPDQPSPHEEFHGELSHHYIEAMKLEISQLLKQKTWDRIDKKHVPKDKNGKLRGLLKGTWALKLKRLFDGAPSKYNARYCVREYLKTEGANYFETYTHIVQ